MDFLSIISTFSYSDEVRMDLLFTRFSFLLLYSIKRDQWQLKNRNYTAPFGRVVMN